MKAQTNEKTPPPTQETGATRSKEKDKARLRVRIRTRNLYNLLVYSATGRILGRVRRVGRDYLEIGHRLLVIGPWLAKDFLIAKKNIAAIEGNRIVIQLTESEYWQYPCPDWHGRARMS